MRQVFDAYFCDCGAKLRADKAGTWICPECHAEFLDSYGRVREFLDENGPQPAVMIARTLNMPLSDVTQLVSEGSLDVLGTKPKPLKQNKLVKRAKSSDSKVRFLDHITKGL